MTDEPVRRDETTARDETTSRDVAAGLHAATRVVTISATYGAGGSLIAPRLAERLGLPFADRLIPAEDVAVPVHGEERVTELEREQTARRRFFARLAQVTGGLGLPVPSPGHLTDPVRQRVEASIEGLVTSGGAVILGRAAAIVLAGHPRAFHVRLDGPESRRLARALTIEHTDADTARARLIETDQARSRYVTSVYSVNPDDARLYHLVVDSTVLETDDVVALLAGAAEAFWSASKAESPPGPTRST